MPWLCAVLPASNSYNSSCSSTVRGGLPVNVNAPRPAEKMAVLFVRPGLPPVSSSLGPGLPGGELLAACCAGALAEAALPPSPGDIVGSKGRSATKLAARVAAACGLRIRTAPARGSFRWLTRWPAASPSPLCARRLTDATVDTLVPCDAECQPSLRAVQRLPRSSRRRTRSQPVLRSMRAAPRRRVSILRAAWRARSSRSTARRCTRA